MHVWGGVGHAGPGRWNLDRVLSAVLILSTRNWKAGAEATASDLLVGLGRLGLNAKVGVFVSRHDVLCCELSVDDM